jgi:hypothetical protein
MTFWRKKKKLYGKYVNVCSAYDDQYIGEYTNFYGDLFRCFVIRK